MVLRTAFTPEPGYTLRIADPTELTPEAQALFDRAIRRRQSN
jgi:hypothetical protein